MNTFLGNAANVAEADCRQGDDNQSPPAQRCATLPSSAAAARVPHLSRVRWASRPATTSSCFASVRNPAPQLPAPAGSAAAGSAGGAQMVRSSSASPTVSLLSWRNADHQRGNQHFLGGRLKDVRLSRAPDICAGQSRRDGHRRSIARQQPRHTRFIGPRHALRRALRPALPAPQTDRQSRRCSPPACDCRPRRACSAVAQVRANNSPRQNSNTSVWPSTGIRPRQRQQALAFLLRRGAQACKQQLTPPAGAAWRQLLQRTADSIDRSGQVSARLPDDQGQFAGREHPDRPPAAWQQRGARIGPGSSCTGEHITQLASQRARMRHMHILGIADRSGDGARGDGDNGAGIHRRIRPGLREARALLNRLRGGPRQGVKVESGIQRDNALAQRRMRREQALHAGQRTACGQPAHHRLLSGLPCSGHPGDLEQRIFQAFGIARELHRRCVRQALTIARYRRLDDTAQEQAQIT